MARLSRVTGRTALVRDQELTALPIMPWGTVHNLVISPSVAARNATAISDDCGVVSICALGGAAHFKQGGSTVVATASDAYLPAGVWHELPVFAGSAWSYVSMIAAAGSDAVKAQICERT